MLKNKLFIIFGAAGLIGNEVTKSILANEGNVIAVDKNFNQLKKRFGNISSSKNSGKIYLKQMDVRDLSLVEKFIVNNKDIDGVINFTYLKNNNFGDKFENVTVKNFNENLSLSLGTTFHINKVCVKWFKKYKKKFSLINIGSIYGAITPRFEIYKNTRINPPVEYSAIKAAVINITKYVSSYVNNSKFRCNCISPGGIVDGQPQIFKKNYKNFTNGKGMLNASDISGTIIFLLSDNSLYITGQNIIIDDGFTL